MYPKKPSNNLTNISTPELDQSNNYYPNLSQSNTISDLSVDEILLKYQDNPQLMNHILTAKAHEEQRLFAERWYQAEQARLQTKFVDYEMNQRQENPQCQQFEHFMNPQQAYYPQSSSMMAGDFYNSQQNNHYQNQPSSFNAELNVSSLPMPASELTYGNNLQKQENISVTSSPSVEFVTPSNFDLYRQDQYQLVNMSSSSTEIDQSLGSFATPTITPAPIIPSHFHENPDSSSQASTPLPTPGTIVKPTPPSQPIKRTRSAKSAHMHRTLSYESVMSLSDFNVNTTAKRTNSLSPPPSSQPLDHDKVMEALRAKLRKSSSSYQTHRPRPSPEPTPPPNTNPTTGVLLLNLKSRRRKTSVTKRNSGNTNS